MLISRLTLAIEPTPSSPFHHEKSCPQKWSDQPRLTSWLMSQHIGILIFKSVGCFFFPAYSSPAIKFVNISTESQEMSTGKRKIADRILASVLDHAWRNALLLTGTQNYSLKEKRGATRAGICPKGHICNLKLLLRSLSKRVGGFCLHMTEITFSLLKKKY